MSGTLVLLLRFAQGSVSLVLFALPARLALLSRRLFVASGVPTSPPFPPPPDWSCPFTLPARSTPQAHPTVALGCSPRHVTVGVWGPFPFPPLALGFTSRRGEGDAFGFSPV